MKTFDETILDYLEEKLTPEERSSFEGAMYDTPGKRALVSNYEAVVALECEASQVDSSTDRALTDAIMLQVESVPRAPLPSFIDRSFLQGFGSAVVICTLILSFLGPSNVVGTFEQLAFSNTSPRIPNNFQTVSLGTKDGLPISSAVNAAQDVEVLIELSSEGGRPTKFLSGILRMGRFPGSQPTLVLEEPDVESLERVKNLIGLKI